MSDWLGGDEDIGKDTLVLEVGGFSPSHHIDRE